MPDAPETMPTTLEEKNKYNLLTTAERIKALQAFWTSIPTILPFQEWTASWKKHATSVRYAIRNRKSALQWLWTIRCGLDKDLEQLTETTFHGLCKEVASIRSGCSTSKRAKTCRRGQSVLRKTRRHKQRDYAR